MSGLELAGPGVAGVGSTGAVVAVKGVGVEPMGADGESVGTGVELAGAGVSGLTVAGSSVVEGRSTGVAVAMAGLGVAGVKLASNRTIISACVRRS